MRSSISELVRVPVLGQVAAGRPVEWIPITGYVDVLPIRGEKGGDLWAIKVVGDSLKNDHIVDGDVAVFRKGSEARPGQLVVALTPDGLTIKYYWPQPDGTVFLMCANDDYDDQIWDGDEVTIRGIVVETCRFLSR